MAVKTGSELTKEVVASIQSTLESLPPVSSNCCIYRVPENLRRVNEEAYRPLLVSIGPLYYDDPKLVPMKEQKLRYLQSFLLRNNIHNSVDYYAETVGRWEQGIRECYVTTIGLSSVAFIEMVLIDAFFIIELFLRAWSQEPVDENDRIFNKPRMISEVTRDLIIEENQLPFSILKCLYDLASSSLCGRPSFIDLTYKFFSVKKDTFPQILAKEDIRHFVDFLRLCHLPTSPKPRTSKDVKFELYPNVTQLSEAGVKFVASQSADLLNIKFSRGFLEIPRFAVTDQAESFFRNIMVFEQCHHYSNSYIIDYFAFLNGLINTPKDVEVLIQSGIIENWLGSNEEVANFFNNIFRQTRLKEGNFYFSDLCKGLNAYASTPWHRWKAILKHDYFIHPWAVISVIYAVVMLVLTVLQTIEGFN
uniref:Uncharacterized protein n=1 Tax=Opuntia streptacantha TaxID=393608 RepID=A0A7C9A3Z6_OPUST